MDTIRYTINITIFCTVQRAVTARELTLKHKQCLPILLCHSNAWHTSTHSKLVIDAKYYLLFTSTADTMTFVVSDNDKFAV